MNHERGTSLIEVVVTVAVVAILMAALLEGTQAAAHRFGDASTNDALRGALQCEMRTAANILKYQSGTIVPATIATTIPLPGATPGAAHMSVTATTLAGGATTVILQASFDAEPNEVQILTTTFAPPAPLPESTIDATGSAPQ